MIYKDNSVSNITTQHPLSSYRLFTRWSNGAAHLGATVNNIWAELMYIMIVFLQTYFRWLQCTYQIDYSMKCMNMSWQFFRISFIWMISNKHRIIWLLVVSQKQMLRSDNRSKKPADHRAAHGREIRQPGWSYFWWPEIHELVERDKQKSQNCIVFLFNTNNFFSDLFLLPWLFWTKESPRNS